MEYVFIEDGDVKEGPMELPMAWRNISGLPYLSSVELFDLGWRTVDKIVEPLLPWEHHNVPKFTIRETDVLVVIEKVEKSVDVAKSWLTTECVKIAKVKRDSIVAEFSAGEMSSWPIKREEAMRFQVSGSALDAPTLNLESEYRQIDLAILVGKVIDKSFTLANVEAAIAGYCGYLCDQIDDAASIEALTQINVNSGWPY